MKSWVGGFCNTVLIIYTSLSVSYALPPDNNTIAKFKEYIRDIQSIAVDFTQEDSHENKASGKLLINKPFKFRCNYYAPFPLVIIGNKNYVSVYTVLGSCIGACICFEN